MACLCLLLGSRWLLEGADPRFASTPWTEAAGAFLAALGFAGEMLQRPGQIRADAPAGGRAWRRSLGVVLILAGAPLGEVLAGRHLGGESATLSLALSAAMIAVLEGADDTPRADLTGRLWPGLAGLAGLLLLLPQPAFEGVRPWVGLASIPVLIGGGAVLWTGTCREPERQGSWMSVGAVAGCVIAAVIFALLGFKDRVALASNVHLRGAVLDGASFWLTLFTARRLGAARWAAQFLFVPLLGLAEGLFVLRPFLDLRSWIGLILLLAGGVRQVFLTREDVEGSTSLRLPHT